MPSPAGRAIVLAAAVLAAVAGARTSATVEFRSSVVDRPFSGRKTAGRSLADERRLTIAEPRSPDDRRVTIAGRQSQLGAVAAHDAPAAVLSKYCVTCHNAKRKTAGLAIDALDLNQVGRDAETWEKVARKLRTQEMPPPSAPRPGKDVYAAMTTYIEGALDAAAAANPNPGRVPVHRLNRTEYANAIRDLLDLEIDPRTLLASDEADIEGFDNMASTLSVSPALLENYLTAARMLSRLAVGDTARRPLVDTFKIERLMLQDERMSEDLPFGSRGGIAVPYHFPADGEYLFKIELWRQLYDYIIGLGDAHQLDIRLDGVLLKRFTVGGEGVGMTAPENFAGNTQGDPEWEEYMHTADAHLEVRAPVKAGRHIVSASFVRRQWEPEGVLQPLQTGFGRTTNEEYFGNPRVKILSIGGPFNVSGPGESSARRRIFVCTPKSSQTAEEEPCAKKILTTVATRAYRRPVTDAEAEILLGFYRQGREESFDAGIQRGLERILAAPSFLFRITRPANAAAPGVYRLSDYDLASRLSFFLWSSVPDAELINAAMRGELKNPAVLEKQARRMLRDPRAQALVNGFATRWLELGKLAGSVPDTQLYPEFDENLREAMAEETRLFVESQIREDRPVTELVSADYTYLNDRLAKHYGVANIYGSHFRRTPVADGRRGGLLGQGALLTVTSYPNRTSVVLRGRWLLANLLGAPPPPPPLDVPALKEAGAEGQPRSLRERMELHRKNPACASCHQRMDPLGFSLENFDAVGKWREEADGVAVDPSASLPDGSTFEGVEGLKNFLSANQEDFVRTLTAKLLSYALGRGLEYYDQPAVRAIARDAARSGNRWSSLVVGIVNSTPFTMARSEE